MENPDLSTLEGKILFAFAGDLFLYDLATETIDFIAERKGRQGPFMSPDAQYFTTNNWPGKNEGVALWEVNTGVIEKEFDLEITLDPDELGVKVSPSATYYSGIVNSLSSANPDFIILDEGGDEIFRIDGDRIRVKGHVWDTRGNLYFTGEILEGSLNEALFLGRISDIGTNDFTLIRIFDGQFADLPDQLAISPDGGQIAYGYKTSIWIGSTEENSENHRECFGAVQTLAVPTFSPDGTHLATVMLNSSTSLRGDLHVAKIPNEGLTTLTAEGATKLPGPNSSLNSTWVSGGDSSIGWFK